MQRDSRGIILPVAIIVVAIVLAASIGALLVVRNQSPSDSGTGQCTLEAKLCPDGSSVGRSGPNCEFAACPGTNTNTTANTNTDENVPIEGVYTIEAYVAQDNYEDSRLIRTEDGKTVILIESTREAAELKRGRALAEFAFPKTGTTIYLASVIYGSDAGFLELWSYSLTDGTLVKLKNVAVQGGRAFVSPNKQKAIWVSYEENGAELKLLDLPNDTTSTLVMLTGNETFNSGWGGLSSSFEIVWLDDRIIRYAVYDQQTGNQAENIEKSKIQDRTVSLPLPIEPLSEPSL